MKASADKLALAPGINIDLSRVTGFEAHKMEFIALNRSISERIYMIKLHSYTENYSKRIDNTRNLYFMPPHIRCSNIAGVIFYFVPPHGPPSLPEKNSLFNPKPTQVIINPGGNSHELKQSENICTGKAL